MGYREKLTATYYDDLTRHCRRRWTSTVAEWSGEGVSADRFWLVGAANYLLRTGGVHWAIDLSFKNAGIFEKLKPSLASDLGCLDFILVTHAHRDHFDPDTVRQLRDLSTRWVIPDSMMDTATVEMGLPMDRIVVVSAGDKLSVEGIAIEAFEGLHWDIPGESGIDSLVYLIDTGARRILFPGDVRNYEVGRIPDFSGVDSLFAHVWLGRDNALNPFPAVYLEKFAAFVASIKARTTYLAHMYETDRKPEHLWTYAHAGMIMDSLAALAPDMSVEIPQKWRGYDL